MSEFRFNPLKKRWVLIDEKRSDKKGYFNIETVKDIEDTTTCPFCPGGEKNTPMELFRKSSQTDDWERRVIPNKFPALQVEKQLAKSAAGPYSEVSGTGAHEIIIESREHFLTLSEHSKLLLYDMFDIFKKRVMDLKKDVRLKYFSLFKNYGYSGGASILHPHSQILATPVIPNTVVDLLKSMQNYYLMHDRCLICDIIDFEKNKGERIIESNSDFCAVIPYASDYPFEIHIYPYSHQHDFFSKGTNYLSLAEITFNVFKKLENKLGNPPINMGIYVSPVSCHIPDFGRYNADNPFFHWHLEIIPRLNKTGGMEIINNTFINPVSPEKAAKVLEG